MKKSFGLLGEKLGHSFSPLIHSYLGDYDYQLYQVAPGELERFMEQRRFDGLNVTIPYKQAVMPYCAALSREARLTGSVNTLIKDANGALHGHNTDYHGFRVMLEQGEIDPRGKKILVLGDGASSRTVRAALNDLLAQEVVTISRRGENHYGNIARHYDGQIIVNTTPVGMYPGNGAAPLCLDGFKRLLGVADLIYNPLKSKLLLAAGQRKVKGVNGLGMLAAQAEAASRLFLECPARPQMVDAICTAVLKKTRNIALIGMPGCGKSTVGRILAEATGRYLADIDQLIEAAAGKTIPQIFAEQGEEAFRRLETRILSQETKKSGIVIAAGGGVVTETENLDLLRQNSLIIYLRRDLAGLPLHGRPLSQSVGLAELAGRRLPLYEAWADRTMEGNAEEIAQKIKEIM